jgi:hypothetical protein
MVLLSPHTVSAADIVIDVGTLAITQSGPLLAGANVVYSHEDIHTWQDGEKIPDTSLSSRSGHCLGSSVSASAARVGSTSTKCTGWSVTEPLVIFSPSGQWTMPGETSQWRVGTHFQ